MPTGAAFSSSVLQLFFNATSIANLAINATSSPNTNLYVSLHTADPSGGTQSTNEVSYTGYARVAVARTSGGWTISGEQVVPAGSITFGTRTDNASTVATWFAVGVGSSGAGVVLWSGQIGAAQKAFTAAVSGNVFTSPAHGYSAGQEVFLETGNFGTLPGGYTAGTAYYVLAAGLATDAFTLSATSGGSVVTVSASGNGIVGTYAPITIALNTTPTLTTATAITLY